LTNFFSDTSKLLADYFTQLGLVLLLFGGPNSYCRLPKFIARPEKSEISIHLIDSDG
jgi:hypothetical protein